MTARSDDEIVEAGRAIVRAEAAAVLGVAEQLGASFLESVSVIRRATGKVFVVGSGTSGAVARRMAHLLAVSGTPAVFVHPMDALHGTMGAFTAGDVLIGISRGGETSEINQLMLLAQKRGLPVIALTAEPDSTFGRGADVTVVLTTAEGGDPGDVIAMGSTLVTAVWGDALANVLMRLSGYGWDQVLETHPAGAVGKLTQLPEQLERLAADS